MVRDRQQTAPGITGLRDQDRTRSSTSGAPIDCCFELPSFRIHLIELPKTLHYRSLSFPWRSHLVERLLAPQLNVCTRPIAAPAYQVIVA